MLFFFSSLCCLWKDFSFSFSFFFFFDDYDKKSEEDIYFLCYHDSFFHLTSSCMSLFRSSMYFDIIWMIYFFFLNIRAHFFSLSISYFDII